MLLSSFIKDGCAALGNLYPPPEARSIILMLCQERLGTKDYTHIIEPSYSIPQELLPLIGRDLERLRQGEPVQYVLGTALFCGRYFHVDRSVLIPRPETELLADLAVRIARTVMAMHGSVRVLDLCTGSGNIAWTLALSVPGAMVVGVDSSETALRTAAGQDFARELGESAAQAPRFVLADLLGEDILEEEPFDLILSNPPYVMESEKVHMRPNVLDFEPPGALFVPDEDPLIYYRAVARWSGALLSPSGDGLTEINEMLGSGIEAVLRADGGLAKTRIIRDFFDKNRIIHYSK